MSQLLDRLYETRCCDDDGAVSSKLRAANLRPQDLAHLKAQAIARLRDAQQLMHAYLCGCDVGPERVQAAVACENIRAAAQASCVPAGS